VHIRRLGSLFKLRTSLKFPILLFETLSSSRESRPSRLIPIASIRLLAIFSSFSLTRLFSEPSPILSSRFSSSQSFSRLMRESRPLRRLMRLFPRYSSFRDRPILSRPFIVSIRFSLSQICSICVAFSRPSISPMP
jgi:hypothetical protein